MRIAFRHFAIVVFFLGVILTACTASRESMKKEAEGNRILARPISDREISRWRCDFFCWPKVNTRMTRNFKMLWG